MTKPQAIISGSSAIPVRNLWLLMLYASRLYQRNHLLRNMDVEQNPERLLDLVAQVLVYAVERRLQRNLGRQYRERRATLARVRGQIDVLTTESKALLAQGRIACRFDELSVDNLRNRIIRSALVLAARDARDRTLQRTARNMADVFTQYGVSPQLVSVRESRQLVLDRNAHDDVEAIGAAQLILEMAIPAESAGNSTNRDPERDAAEIRRLYEAAVRGFYRSALPSSWSVSPGETHYHWPLVEATEGLKSILPIMKADTVLETVGRRIIVETKFADALKPNQYGLPKLARNHVFQLYAYVQSQHGSDELSATAEGVLLYPVVGEHVDESASIQGHRYRFLTVDLGGPAESIRSSLLRVTSN